MPQSSHRIIGIIRIEQPAPLRIDVPLSVEDDSLDGHISALVGSRRRSSPPLDRWRTSSLFRPGARAVVAADVGRLQDELDREYLELACR